MIAQIWDEQGEHQQTFHSGQGRATKISILHKKYRKMRKLKARELAFSRAEHANCLSIVKWSSLKA